VNEVVTWHNRLGTYQIVRRRNVRLVAMADNVAFARHHLVEPIKFEHKPLFRSFVRMKFWNFKERSLWLGPLFHKPAEKGATTFCRTALSRMTFISRPKVNRTFNTLRFKILMSASRSSVVILNAVAPDFVLKQHFKRLNYFCDFALLVSKSMSHYMTFTA